MFFDSHNSKQMKKILFFIAILGTMTLVSCQSNEPNSPVSTPEALQYSFSKAVVDEATYSFISYKVVSGSVEVNPSTSNYSNPCGAYIYRNSGLIDGILEPCEVDTLDFHYIKRDPSKGQALDLGTYKTYCISPAIPWMRGYDGSMRVRFPRDIQMYASRHPFDMDVTGYNVFEVPDTVILYAIQSKMSIDIVQGASSTFEITDPELVNGGTFGFYEPQRRVTAITYSANPIDFVTKGNREDISPDFQGPLVPTGSGVKNNLIYKIEEEPVFAQQYVTGYETLTMRLDFKIEMNGDGNIFNMGVPLGIDMEPGKHYKFTIVVKSIFVELYYCVADWDTGYNANDEIGGDGLKVLIGTYCLADWIPGNPGGTDVIGGNTP